MKYIKLVGYKDLFDWLNIMYYLSILHDIIWAHVSMYGRVLEVASDLRDFKQYQQSQCDATSVAKKLRV